MTKRTLSSAFSVCIVLSVAFLMLNCSNSQTVGPTIIAEEAFLVPEILADVSWENLRMQNNRMNVDKEIISRASELGVPEGRLERAREYMENLQSLSAGNTAPDFEIIDVNGEIARLNDFSGKYLLIDVWSHTCGPCIREIPRLEEIKHDLKGRNIEVKTVCMSPESPWKSKLKELGLKEVLEGLPI